MADWLGRIQDAVRERTGMTVVEEDRLRLLEASDVERRALTKELDLMGWTVLDYVGGQPQEQKFVERRKMAQEARMVWLQDPMAAAAVDLRNDFVFGRGVPVPKCADAKVQEVVDEAWRDPDNKLVLTSYEAQVALGTDLELTSNVFVLFFDDGDDGKVKLALLDHDTVEDAVRDPDNRMRVLYYVARERKFRWDYDNDRPAMEMPEMGPDARPKVLYYEHLTNVKAAKDEGRKIEQPPKGRLGDGRVYHIAVNRTSEQVFGNPAMRRVTKWFSAFNDLMKARVDMAQAAAAFVMKRKIKGSQNQVARMAAKAVSRRSDLSTASMDEGYDILAGPKPASILNENEQISHEPFSINTNSQQAQADLQMIRSQVSAATRFPQHYLGDASTANLATATALELPVLKSIEARQELFEGLFRAFTDRVIEKAVEAGRLSKELDDEERAAMEEEPGEERLADGSGAPAPAAENPMAAPGVPVAEAYAEQGDDEKDTERDLSYELGMPNPLKRGLTDLIGAIANIARTFDPNNSNPELSRALLSIALGEGLEVADPAAMVDRIFPEGYVDPAVAAAQAQQGGGMPPGGAPQPNFFGPDWQGSDQGGVAGADGQQHPADNPYGAKQKATPPEQMSQSLAALPEPLQRRVREREAEIEDQFQRDVMDLALDAMSGKNGNGHG